MRLAALVVAVALALLGLAPAAHLALAHGHGADGGMAHVDAAASGECAGHSHDAPAAPAHPEDCDLCALLAMARAQPGLTPTSSVVAVRAIAVEIVRPAPSRPREWVARPAAPARGPPTA